MIPGPKKNERQFLHGTLRAGEESQFGAAAFEGYAYDRLITLRNQLQLPTESGPSRLASTPSAAINDYIF